VWRIATEPLTVPAFYGVLGGETVQFFKTEADGCKWMRMVGVRRGRPSVRRMTDHYAAFPGEWPRRLILGWSPPGICTACGEGRRPALHVLPDSREPYRTVGMERRTPTGGMQSTRPKVLREDGKGGDLARNEVRIVGYVCACTPYTDHPGTGGSSGADGRNGNAVSRGDGYPTTDYSTELRHRPKVGPWREYHLDRWIAPPTRPAVILDPFGGTGTVAMVARALGRTGVTFDLSHDYSRVARWRIFESGHASKVIGRTWRDRQQTLALDTDIDELDTDIDEPAPTSSAPSAAPPPPAKVQQAWETREWDQPSLL
jgi:hypothetical protein